MRDKNFDISELLPEMEPNGTGQAENHDQGGPGKEKTVSVNRKIKGRYVLLALVVVALGVYAGYLSQKSVSITHIAVDGTYFVKPEAVVNRVHLQKGINPDSLNFIKIIRSVEQLPYVRQAYIRVVPPHELVIRVNERQPAAMLINGRHKIYVDTAGVKLPIIEGKSRDVPLVYGFSATGAGDTLTSSSFRSVASFLKAANKHPLVKAMISEIAFTQDDGIVALSQPDGVKIIFGDKNFDRKFTYWEAFYRQVVPGKGLNHLYSVDLRFKGQVVTRDQGT